MFDELTQKDIDEMNAEINDRIKLRDGYHEDIIMAKSYGDLSENAEYHEAKRSKNKNEARIRYLRNMIKTATIIDASKTQQNKNTIGYFDKVTIYFEDENELDTVIISTKVRVDASKGVISKESPLGNAIFGKKAGDRVFVNVSDDVKYYVVIKNIEKCNSDADVPINKY